MFKDYDKYLSKSLQVYIFVLLLIFILKLVGMDYFQISNQTNAIVFLDKLMDIYLVRTTINFTLIMIYQYIMVSIITQKKVVKYTLLTIPFTFIFNGYVKAYIWGSWISIFIEALYLLILCLIIAKPTKKLFKNFLIMFFVNLLFQIISNITRNNGNLLQIQSRSIDLILNLDYLLMMIILYKVYFMKGVNELCQKSQAEVGSSLLKKINLKKLLRRLQANLHKFRKLPKQERLSISIYIFLSLLWNTLSLVIVLLVANLNHTFIECLFILTSFWLSKNTFGKPFHLPNMIHCFIVSNLTYYILNRITTPLGISIFVPILLGVGLSYITSKLVKKTYKPLYRGMPKELFDETILKIIDKNSINYKICYGFYINKKSDLSLSFEYNYSVAGIRKIKDRINDKIKGLN